MSADEKLQLERLKRFLYPMVPVTIAFFVTYLAGAILLQSTALAGAAAMVLILVFSFIAAAVWAHKRSAVIGPALLAGYSLLLVVALATPFIQFAAAALVIIPFTAATLIISYATDLRLKLFLLATFAVEVVVITVCIFLPPFFEQPPLWLQNAVNAAAVAVAAGLALRLIWADSERLRRAVTARDDFLAMAAHELRTPLTAASLTLDGIVKRGSAGSATPEWTLKQTENTRRALRRLMQLVEALLDVSRIGAGRLELSLTRTDLSELAAELVERFAVSSPAPLLLEAARPVVGQWDHLRIEQVLVNLIGNAVKYGEGKPITVRVSAREGFGVFEVRDQGMGFSAEAQSRLFERYHREVPSSHYGGLGLGLWISRNIVEAHGGTIKVSGEPGKGSAFQVELPTGRV